MIGISVEKKTIANWWQLHYRFTLSLTGLNIKSDVVFVLVVAENIPEIFLRNACPFGSTCDLGIFFELLFSLSEE